MKLLFFLFCIFLLNVLRQVNGKKHIYRQIKTFSVAKDNNSLQKVHRTEERINLSYPGTKWCGPGSTATDYNDLGESEEVDICCRQHDHCDNIPSGETKNNLTNKDLFTRLHCDCDKVFYDCLHKLDSRVSNRVGEIYFTLRDRCYRNDYPIVECTDYETTYFIRRCDRYILDESSAKLFQWFDLPLYNGPLTHRSAVDEDAFLLE